MRTSTPPFNLELHKPSTDRLLLKIPIKSHSWSQGVPNKNSPICRVATAKMPSLSVALCRGEKRRHGLFDDQCFVLFFLFFFSKTFFVSKTFLQSVPVILKPTCIWNRYWRNIWNFKLSVMFPLQFLAELKWYFYNFDEVRLRFAVVSMCFQLFL